MVVQYDFDFARPPVSAEVDQLINHLLLAGNRWVNSKELSSQLPFNERKIRQLAEHSDGIIISGPGCPGYKHINCCTSDQIREVSNRLKSQAKSMLRRSIRLRNRAHTIIS